MGLDQPDIFFANSTGETLKGCDKYTDVNARRLVEGFASPTLSTPKAISASFDGVIPLFSCLSPALIPLKMPDNPKILTLPAMPYYGS